MAHFAQLNSDNEVIEVVVVNNDILSQPETESLGIAYLQDMFGEDTIWVQTSINNNFRNVYASKDGGIYDPDEDKFYPAKPYDYFVWDSELLQWLPPLEYPADSLIKGGDKAYIWDNNTYQADNTTGWIEQT